VKLAGALLFKEEQHRALVFGIVFLPAHAFFSQIAAHVAFCI